MIGKYKLLADDNSINIIIDTLSLISQLARISKDFYEHIHTAKFGFHPVEQRIDGGTVARVAGDGHGLAASRVNLFRHGVEAFLFTRTQHDCSALLGVALRDGLADSAAGPRD